MIVIIRSAGNEARKNRENEAGNDVVMQLQAGR
jgi:hypothetical protein